MYYIHNDSFYKNDDKFDSNPFSDFLNYGYALFETIKVTNLTAEYIDAHLQRLRKSSTALNINLNYSDQELKYYVEKLIEKNAFNGALKILLAKNINSSDLIITMKKKEYQAEDYQKGFNLKISQVLRNSTSKIIKHKTANYLENILEFRKAKAEGFDEVIFFNEKGYLAEGAISNIFIVKEKKLYTPGLENGLLNGILRRQVILQKKFEVEEKNIKLDLINQADEIFITNSLLKIMPVRTIKNTEFENNNFKISEKISQII
ncbi:aminotransferase class IV [Halanaerobium hydrogeniformans]|uniref:Aminotransferase class IV n=1 Tax=Halanaerobium hydrogeniformans TaxID=656519 RepID=E4RNF1_HALHG|nr:aminotransferase class IV [Halanaerobium hydrogeniformans]ADQ13619.1 aminotransferase class IV [Halanaerobium hydrogeniformans]